MPKVALLDFTGRGSADPVWYAANVLLFTKNTRLSMSVASFNHIENAMTPEMKLAELAAMAKTIPSSWEFVDVTFLLSGVTRACAQQITRTRTASYAMQSQRIVDMSDATVTNPLSGSGDLANEFDNAADAALQAYVNLVQSGVAAQDARGILPMNTQCNLVAKYNLRSFIDLVHSRSSLRTQGEYADIVHQMVDAVKEVWPWVGIFLADPYDAALEELESVAKSLGVVPGNDIGWRIAKAIDLLRRS